MKEDLLRDRREHFLREAKLMQSNLNKSRPAEKDKVMVLNLKVICSDILDYNIDPRMIGVKLDYARNNLRQLYESEAEIYTNEQIETEQVELLYAALDALAVRCAKGITGAWQEVLWMAINISVVSSSRKWTPSKLVIDWVLKVLNCPTMCTEPAQAYYLLNFVLMWPHELLAPKKIGRQLVEGCVASGQNLRIHRGVVEDHQHAIGNVTKDIIRILREKDHLDLFSEKVLEQIKEHRMGLELHWVTNLIQYILGQVNVRVEGYVDYHDRAMKAVYAAKLFEEMVTSEAFRLFLFASGVKTVTSLVIFEILKSAVTCFCNGSPRYNFAYQNAFESISVLCSHVEYSIINEIKYRHAYELQNLTSKLLARQAPAWASIPFKLLKEYEDIEDSSCPEEFIDILTMDIMQMPICLPTSENVVDEGTFYRLLLTEREPRDPYTQLPLMNEKGSFAYTKLPRLARRIKRWQSKPYQK